MDFSREIFKAFKIKGLTVTSQASKALSRVLATENSPEETLQIILDEIKERIRKRDIKSSFIDEDVIVNVIADLSSSEEDLSKEKFQLLDAFSSPKIQYDENNKSYKLLVNHTYKIHGDVFSRANMYRERLILTLQRLLRSGTFVMSGLTRRTLPPDVHEISTISSLLGSSSTKILFGMLTQPEEGSWYLEDLTSSIKLDLSRCQHHARSYYYTEGCQVIVEGSLFNGSFHATVLVLTILHFCRSSVLCSIRLSSYTILIISSYALLILFPL